MNILEKVEEVVQKPSILSNNNNQGSSSNNSGSNNSGNSGGHVDPATKGCAIIPAHADNGPWNRVYDPTSEAAQDVVSIVINSSNGKYFSSGTQGVSGCGYFFLVYE